MHEFELKVANTMHTIVRRFLKENCTVLEVLAPKAWCAYCNQSFECPSIWISAYDYYINGIIQMVDFRCNLYQMAIKYDYEIIRKYYELYGYSE